MKTQRMKKTLFTGVALLAIVTTASAQNLYLNVSAGYGLALPGERLGTNTTSSSTENIYGTLGPGLSIGLAPGYFFTEHLGVELGFNYFMGSDVEVQKTQTAAGTATITAHSNQFRITPSLVLRTGNGDLYGYGKMGIVLPIAGTTFTNVDDTGAAGPGTAGTTAYETKGAPSFGFSGALGVNYSFNERFALFGELNTVNLRINAKSRTMTEATSNGTDVLGSLNTYQKETTYQDKLDGSSNNAAYNSSYSTGQAKDDLRTRNNFSALFINIGLRISF
jgi:opacity protein-like surface antigen